MTVKTVDTSHRPLTSQVRLLIAARVVDRLGGFTLTFLPLLLVTAYGASLREAGLVGAGLTGCAIAQVTLALASGLAVALPAAVALGLCFEVYEPPSQALLADLTAPAERVAAYSALSVGIAAAGIVAGLLAAVLAGVGLRWLFVADAGTCLACAALVRLRLPGGDVPAPARSAQGSPRRDRRLRVMLGTGTAFATVSMTTMCGLPLALHRDGAAPGWAGLLVALSAATVIVAARIRRHQRGDPFSRMRTGYLLLGLGLLGAAVGAAVAGSGWGYVIPVVVWSVGDAVLLGEPLAVVAGLATDAERGRYLAAYGVSWGLATTFAPALATGLLAAVGSPGLWAACALAAASLAAVQSRVGVAVARP